MSAVTQTSGVTAGAADAPTDLTDRPAITERRASGWTIMLSRPLTVVCLAVIVCYILAACSTYLPIMERAIDTPVGSSYAPPRLGSPSVWFGTDILGRSVLWRTVYGTRVALLITLGAGGLSVIIGTTLGILSGYFGGWIDVLVTWLFTTISSIPWILLVVAILFALQSRQSFRDKYGDLPAIIIALAATDWVGLCRLLRGEVFKYREADFVAAARAAGAGTPRILLRHILPNVFHIVIITFSLSTVGYVQAEVALTFLGIGISTKPSWGRMITDAKLEVLRGVWWQLTAATIAIFVICLTLNIVGDALRDALDPKLRGRN